jgi:hypothetical protein
MGIKQSAQSEALSQSDSTNFVENAVIYSGHTEFLTIYSIHHMYQ